MDSLFFQAKVRKSNKIYRNYEILKVMSDESLYCCFESAMIAYKAIPTPRTVVKIIHLTLHFIALVSGIFGVYAVFKFHDELKVPHMYTLHSWIGMSTIVLFGLQVIFNYFRKGIHNALNSKRFSRLSHQNSTFPIILPLNSNNAFNSTNFNKTYIFF